MTTTQPTELELLTIAWLAEKNKEAEANAERIRIESRIYELTQNDLPEKGTHTLPTGMKIVTGYAESWDEDVLNTAYQNWQAPLPFPFKGQWKPDAKQITYIRENCPELYRLIQPALTLKPKKPAFSLPTDK